MNEPTVKVKMLDGDIWVYGFITIQRDVDAKVLFEFPETGLNYWYYYNTDFTIITEEEYNKAKLAHQEERM
jgi:hypothetical protein